MVRQWGERERQQQLHVIPDRLQDHRHAISLAASGDAINIAAATYAENLSIPFNLTIAGAGTTTTIEGRNVGRMIPISDQNSYVKLSNLTLRDGHATYGAGILNYGTLTLSPYDS